MKDFQISSDNQSLCRYHWPVQNPKLCLIIVHGMAEHVSRYDTFATHLQAKGVASLGLDIRGHGESLLDGRLGWFGPGGWRRVVQDFAELIAFAKGLYPDCPLAVFGHSMGSIFTQAILMEAPANIDAAVITGPAADQPGRRNLAPIMANIVKLFNGDKQSPFLNNITFASYNAAFKPARTEFDWLSRIPENVDTYIADPLCGFVCTSSLYRDVASMICHIMQPNNVEKVPLTLSLMAFSGSCDPVGNDGKTLNELTELWKKVGRDFTAKLIPGARHELLNDLCADEVEADILSFFEKTLRIAL